MRLKLDNQVPAEYNRQSINSIVVSMQNQINGISEGTLKATHNAATAAPTAGTYSVGDFVKNATPSELGAGGSKYILLGWMAISSSPLIFTECRVLTGN